VGLVRTDVLEKCIACIIRVERLSKLGRKMSDNNLELQININFCVKICKSTSETALLTIVYGEYAMRK
jgi:hypothetical protein